MNLFSPCLLGHDERIREYRPDGLYLVCLRCQDAFQVLADQPTGKTIKPLKARKAKKVASALRFPRKVG